jgi:drug/metabolite transporter (DMT)-like permease
MHFQVLIGLALALACAAGASISGLWKQKGAVQVADVDVRRPVQTAVALFRSKWFAIGWIVALAAWLLHVGALAMAPISLAQAVISGGLVLLGVFAERFFGFKVSRRQWMGLIVLAAGMAALTATSHSESDHTSFGILAISAFELLAIGFGVAFIMTHRIRRLCEQHGLMLGIAAGILFGVSDISIKAVTSGSHGVLGILGPWTLFGVLCGLGAFYASARSLQIGNAVAVIAATATAANVLGIAGGIVVFGDPLGNDALTVGGRLLAFCLVIFAVGLMPAPVRAQKAVREEEEQAQRDEKEDEAAPADADGARPAPVRQPRGEKALVAEQA